MCYTNFVGNSQIFGFLISWVVSLMFGGDYVRTQLYLRIKRKASQPCKRPFAFYSFMALVRFPHLDPKLSALLAAQVLLIFDLIPCSFRFGILHRMTGISWLFAENRGFHCKSL